MSAVYYRLPFWASKIGRRDAARERRAKSGEGKVLFSMNRKRPWPDRTVNAILLATRRRRWQLFSTWCTFLVILPFLRAAANWLASPEADVLTADGQRLLSHVAFALGEVWHLLLFVGGAILLIAFFNRLDEVEQERERMLDLRLRVFRDRERDPATPWVAEFPDLPEAAGCGKTPGEAKRAALAVALRVLANQLERGEFVAPVSEQSSFGIRWS